MTGAMSIFSNLPNFNCKPAEAAWKRANETFTEVPGTPDYEGHNFDCSSTPIKKKHLSNAAKLGIGLGLALGGILLIFGWASMCDKNMRKKVLAKNPPASQELELQDRDTTEEEHTDVLPQYTPATGPADETGQGLASGNAVGEEANIPPHYSHATGVRGDQGQMLVDANVREETGAPPEYITADAGNEHSQATVAVEDAGNNGRRQEEQVSSRE